MDDRAEGQKYSKLDWPTPEMLARAHRLWAEAFKEMAGNCGRRMRRWLGERLRAASRSKASPAKVRISGRR